MRRKLPDDRRELLALGADRGLSMADARERLARFGPNDYLAQRSGTWRELVSDTARDPMLWFLLAMGGLYPVLGDLAESVVLFASVVPLVAMDFVLHHRTRASTQGLRSHLVATATVIRDGRAQETPAEQVVPGDLARVAPGAAFPADGLIVAGEALQADESALTGEAHPVRKRPLERDAIAAPGLAFDLEHWAFAGTRLLTGTALVRVVTTGRETLYGEIVRSASSGTHAHTPLQQALAALLRGLLAAAVLLCAVLAWVRLQQGFGWVDALVSALTLAVAALPEEFPVVLVMFLGVGVYRLARRRALVRRSVSVENIGRVTCICSDKTGTLTLGSLLLAHRLPARAATPESAAEDSSARVAARDRRSARRGDPGRREASGARGSARPRGVSVHGGAPPRDRRGSGQRWSAAGRDQGRTRSRAGAVRDGLARARAVERARVAACRGRPQGARLRGARDRRGVGRWRARSRLRLRGTAGLRRPRAGRCRGSCPPVLDAGIRVVMVTGDHPATAAAVGREIGLCADAARVVTGDEIEALVERGGARALDGVDVVARAFPAQKLALVRALQGAGEIVAVTGDGVNDVPALQAADIGIAMGERGTRSAREAAAIVLLDDDFRTIVGAIAEGRQLFRNLQNSFRYLLTIQIPLVVTAALIPLSGYPLLYLPIHVVWLELIIHPSALLAFQDLPNGRLVPLQRGTRAAFFSVREWARIGAVGALLTAALVAGYAMNLGGGVEHARAGALALLSIASAGVTASLTGLLTPAALILSTAAVAVGFVAIQLPALAVRLHLAPLHAVDWAVALLGATLACVPLAFRGRIH